MQHTGYPIEDLALRASFVEASRTTLDNLARRLAEEGADEAVVIGGYLDESVRDAARLGRPKGIDEARYSVPGAGVVPGKPARRRRGSGICENLWQDGGPVTLIARQVPACPW